MAKILPPQSNEIIISNSDLIINKDLIIFIRYKENRQIDIDQDEHLIKNILDLKQIKGYEYDSEMLKDVFLSKLFEHIKDSTNIANLKLSKAYLKNKFIENNFLYETQSGESLAVYKK